MKKLFILFVLGLSVPALAEIVSTVSFNPSRIGTYDYLKISRDANFKGGLETTGPLNIESAGTVTMRWDNANGYYEAPTVTGVSGAAVNMPATTFLTDTSLSTMEINYSANNATAPAGVGPNITMTGGSLSFGGSTANNDSYVSVLNGANTVQFRADALNENTLNIDGNAGKSVALTTDGTTYTAKNESANTKGEASTYTRGFHLAGVDIPYPTGDYVQKTGTTALASNAALCWVQRCTAEGKVAWVLSLVNGTCPAKKDISCGGGDPLDPDKTCATVGQSCDSGVGYGKGVWVTDSRGGCCCEVVCPDNLPEGVLCTQKCIQTGIK